MSSAYVTEWVRQAISSSHITRKEVHFSCCLVVLPCLEGKFRRLLVSTLLRCVRKGSHQGKFPEVSEWTKAKLFGHGGGTEIQELSMTCIAQAGQRMLLQLMTATSEFMLGGTLKAMPPCWIMLFLQPQNVVFRLKLYEIGCTMRNFTPDVYTEVHIWHLGTMQRGTDGPYNSLNGLVRIGIKFCSQIKCCICIQPDNRRTCVWRQSGQAERLMPGFSKVETSVR